MSAGTSDLFEVVVLSTPNYLHHLSSFLSSFQAEMGSDVRLTVVHSGGALPAVPTDVELIHSERPLGCGAARELARRRTSAAWVLYTDSDVIFPPGFRDLLTREIARAEKLNSSGVQLDFKPTRATRWGRFEFLLDRMVILNRSEMGLAGEWWDIDRKLPIVDAERTPVTLRCMQGFGMLLRKDALDAIGGFDPRLDSGEDRDVAARLIKAGGKIHLAQDCFVFHSYDFGLRRILLRKAWHGEFSALTSAIHPDLYPGSIASCLRMMSSSVLFPPPSFRSVDGRVYFLAQAMAFSLSHIAHAVSLRLSRRSAIIATETERT